MLKLTKESLERTDKRIIMRKVMQGEILENDLQKLLQTLPDATGMGEYVSVPMETQILQENESALMEK